MTNPSPSSSWIKSIKNIVAQRSPHPTAPQTPEPYVPAPELVEALNLAVYLGRPLLLEGEPGCGKTRFSRAIAYEFGLPYFPWFIKSTGKAQEGLYSYDAIRRLHDVQIKSPQAEDAKNYREFGKLGQAFNEANNIKSPPVVLIDEIDKADIDFPNDLLSVLDKEGEFPILETGETIRPGVVQPIVIITSNQEKPLPDAFLRRCLYHYIEFPDSGQLEHIVSAHYALAKETSQPVPSKPLIEAAIQRLLTIRQELQDKIKAPSTSEFLDWLQALVNFERSEYPANKLADDRQPLPYPQILFKQKLSYRDYGRVRS
ncbi:MAG: MoxR family ATPase [Anaerolineales bacterium]|nr:MoxR family ATPase [Anaerolineales bacterium]